METNLSKFRSSRVPWASKTNKLNQAKSEGLKKSEEDDMIWVSCQVMFRKQLFQGFLASRIWARYDPSSESLTSTLYRAWVLSWDSRTNFKEVTPCNTENVCNILYACVSL